METNSKDSEKMMKCQSPTLSPVAISRENTEFSDSDKEEEEIDVVDDSSECSERGGNKWKNSKNRNRWEWKSKWFQFLEVFFILTKKKPNDLLNKVRYIFKMIFQIYKNAFSMSL